MSVAAFSDGATHEGWEEETYLFSSAPSTPRERTPDILVRFQAVSNDRPCLDSRTVFISSQCTLIEARRHIQRHFQCLFERGFIFLRQHREIGRSQERAIRLMDILPKLRLGQPRPAFVFPGLQYKKLPIENDGRRSLAMCVGVVYVCEASSESTWSHQALREELSGNPAFINSFAFVPAYITSANQDAIDLKVDELSQLASAGDKTKLQLVLSLLPSDIIPKKIKDHRSATPLHYASQNGHVEVCEVLIGRFGYDILYMKDCNLRTPLHCALHAKKINVICYLLHLSPDLEWHDILGFSCARMLHGLNSRDMHELMTRLEPGVLDPQLVLQFAVFAMTSKDIKQAVRYCRFAPVVQAPFYRPPLHLAAELGNNDIIQALLSTDAVRKSPYRRKFSVPSSDSFEEVNNSFETSRYAFGASSTGQTPRSSEMTYRLTSNSPDRDTGIWTARTDSGISSCSMKNGSKGKRGKSKSKVKQRDPDIVSELDVLLEEVVDTRHSPISRDSDGHLPFHYACQHGHHAILPHLYFTNMSQADFLKGVKLALNWKRFEVIQILPTLRTDYTLDGDTLSTIIKESERDICMIGHALLPLLRPHTHHMTRLLPHAAMIGAGDVVQMLLKMNVPPDMPDFLGRTPLHEACQQNRIHVVGVLLKEAKADPNLRDWRGSTPLHYACAAGHLEVVEMLLGCRRTTADLTDVRGRTPLLTAAHCNQQHVLSALVKRHLPRLSPLHTDVEGRNVLHYLTNVPIDEMKQLIQGVKEFKDKGITPRTEPFYPPQPYDIAREAELREVWDDPAHIHKRADVRGKHASKSSQRKQRLMMTISCQRCGKSFSCTKKTKNWYHVCSNPCLQSAPPSLSTNTLGKNMVRLPTFLPAGTDSSEQDSRVVRHVQRLPIIRQVTPSQCSLTPLDVAILNNKNEVMAELVQAFPELAKRQSTAVLAARMANCEALRTLHKGAIFTKDFLTHLVHIAIIQRPADHTTYAQFSKCIRFLFKLGASPNYMPDPKDFKADRLSPSEESRMPFMALEVAAILGDFNLAELLLENGASASISFAVHLAALKGNTKMLKKLLPHWKEGRWKPYIKGFDADANELVRVCTLESGLVQAACASEQVSMELLKLVVEEKDILAGKKILTHHMVFAIRPHVCCLTRPTLMNKILYKHIDETAEDDHVCQHLPLSNLLRCLERNVRRKQVETMAVYLLQQGAYLSDMRVSRKSQVHVACEVFVLGVKRRMWKLVEVLLIDAGIDIWLCLLAPHHTCHKYVYRPWIDDRFVKREPTDEWSDGHSGFLCLSKGMLRVFRLLPLNLLRHFLEKGKTAMKESALDGLRAVLMPRDTEELRSPRSPRVVRSPQPPSNTSQTAEKTPMPVPPMSPAPAVPGSPKQRSTPKPDSPRAKPASPRPAAASPRPPGSASSFRVILNGGEQELHAQLMTQLLAYHVRQADGTRGQLMVLSKLTLLCPPLLTRSLPILRFHLSRHTWLPHAPRHALTSALKKHTSTTRAIRTLGTELMEVSMWIKMSALPVHQVMAIQEQGLTLLHLAQGSSRLLDVLVKNGAHAPRSILVAACVGKAYTDFYTEKSDQARFPDEKTKLFVVQWCAKTLKERIDLAYFHPTHGTVFDVILKKHHWAIFDWLVVNTEVEPIIKLLARCRQFSELAQAPEAVIVRLLKSLGEVLLVLPDDVMHKLLLALTLRIDTVLERVVRRLMSLSYFSSHNRLLALVTARGPHNETIMHNMCRVGHVTTLKLFLCLFSQNISGNAEISDNRFNIDVSSSRERIDLAYFHPTHGTVFDVILKKHHWAIFDWLVVNTEVEPIIKLLARCRQFSELAQAPEAVIVRLLKSLGEVLLVLPDDVMHKLLLALTLRIDTVLERVVRRLMSLSYFSSHNRLLALVTARGPHNETIMHNMCRVGHVTTLKLFLCLFSQNISGNAEISDFLDAVDNSGCTPLWYCLAHKRWTMAEYLMTSGIRVSPKRAVPDFCAKRSFALCRHRDIGGDLGELLIDRTRRRSSVVMRNNSSQIVSLLSPDSDLLLKVYQNPPSPPSLKSPREDALAKSILVTTFSDSGFSTSEGDITVMSEGAGMATGDGDRRNLRYLLSLIHYAGLKGATLVHAAAAVGDKDLLEGLVKSPYCSAQLAFSRTYSPFIYALANSRIETVNACFQYGLGPYDDDPVSYTLARAILARCGVRDSEMSLRRLLAHQKVSPETEEGIMNLVSTRAPSSHKVRNICTHISATTFTCLEHDLVKIVHEVVKRRKGKVSEVLLAAAGVTGNLWVFKAIMDAVENKARLAELCTRHIVPKAAFIDLLYLFAPRRMTLEKYAPEYFDRMKILRCISIETRLVLQPQTLRAAIKKNLLPMLEMVIKDHIRNRMPLQPSSLWFESIFKASTIGDNHYVNTICAANLNVKVNVLQTALLRALCLACLHRHKQIANRLLLFKLPLLTPVTDLPGEFYMQPQLVLETAIEGGDSVVASLILQTMEETGTTPNSEDILRAIFMAFRKGMEPIIDNLLMFAHYVAPDLISVKICHRLFLVAARSSHGRICNKFLNLEQINVTAVDTHGFTALHYACMYDKASLVRSIITVAPSSVQATTPDGLTPLDLARCMGNWELAYELIGEHGAVRGDGFIDPEAHGWMNRMLQLNAEYEEEHQGTSIACPGSREMTIQNLLRRGDDRSARCLLEVAQESMVSCMLDYYPAYPLLHLCARYGCEASLQLLLKLVEAQPQIDNKFFLENEIEGMIPLALAIRGGHVGCTQLLIGAHYPSKWRVSSTEESILHIAARGGQEEIVQLVSERASNSFLQSQDKDGLIPATTAVAYGNHHIVKPLLRGLRFAEKLHHSHLQTTYWCILCLLDMCIGWSKSFQEGRTPFLNRKGRNVFQRHRTEAGFSICSDVAARAVMGRVLDSAEGRTCLMKWMTPEAKKVARRRGPLRPKADLSLFYTEGLGSKSNLSHTLDSLESWTRAGASTEILENALGTMQYANRGYRSQLFLLLSHMTRFEAIHHVIRKGQDPLATYLYSKLQPTFDMDQKLDFFRHACAHGLPSLAEAMMTTDPEVNFLAVPDKQTSKATPLDIALAFGHSSTAALLMQKLDGDAIKEAIPELRALTPYLSVNTQWKLGMSTIGDPAWKASLDFSLCRLSHVDLYLITHQSENSFPGTLLPRDIMAMSVCGKQLDVDHHGMKSCVSELGVDDTWITAHILSRAVLGRYHTEVDKDTEGWQMIDKISLHCVPNTSGEEAKVVLQGHKLHDIVKVEKHKSKDGSTRFSVITGPFPLSLTTTHFVKQRLVSDVLPEFKRRLAVIHGLAMDVVLDWNSVDSMDDLDAQRHLINILTGEYGSAPLAGLEGVMDNCMEMFKDMALLVNRASVQEVKNVLSQTKTIVIKYVKELPASRGNLEFPMESRALWYFSLGEDGSLVYNTNLFTVYIFTSLAHTMFTCLAPSLRRFPDPPPSVGRSAFSPDSEIREEASDAANVGTEEQQSATNEGKSTVGTNMSEVGGTTAPSDITADVFWGTESPGEDVSRLAPFANETAEPKPVLPCIEEKRQVVKLVEVEDDRGVVLDIAWDNFTFLPEVRRLLHFIRNAISPEIDRMSDSYAALQPLDLGIGKVAIRTVFSQDGAGLDLKDDVLTINLHCFSQLDETWGIGTIDSDSFFFEKRTSRLCAGWRTGSMQMSASLNESTRRMTRALGFPVALPVAGQTTLEMLCRAEGRQMTHPYKLLKQFLKCLSRNLTNGYVQAVTTALSYSGHCWVVDQADVPSAMWCWVRLHDVVKRKPGERYLVMTRTEHGKTLFHMMRGCDVLTAAPGMLAGVWHRSDQGVEGNTGMILKDVITDRVQLITVNGQVFFTTQSRVTAGFMSSLPISVEIGMATESPFTKALWFDEVFLRPLELGGDRTRTLACTTSFGLTTMQCWQIASSLGFHLVFDLMDFAVEDPVVRDRKCLMSSTLMLETLHDIIDTRLCEPNVVQTVRKLLSTFGTVCLSHKLVDRALHIVRGGVYDEEVNIYLLTEKDLQVAPLPSVWDRHEGPRWPKPFTETLRCALCASFSLQTRSTLSELFSKKLSRMIHADDISFIEFAERPDKLRTLAMSHEAVTGFLAALTHFIKRYLSGMRKMKSELTSVIFTEDVPVGPVVSFHAGILKVGLFKNCRPVERRTFISDLLVAVAVDEDIDDEDMAPTKEDEPSVQLLQRPRAEDACPGLSVASSARRRAPKVKHIVRAPSDNKYTVERAVQRLLAGADTGKTGDIMDSLEIGASVNCVNQKDETPLVLAAKGRNYVIQELLLSRGADVNWCDHSGMTALHYEAGHGDVEAVKMLLAHGADPNAQDAMGRTPLHFSVTNSHAETTDSLVFCGADASIVNMDGRTPRALCQNRAQRQMMRRSDVTVRGLATENVFVEHLLLEANTAYKARGVGISLRTLQNLGQVKTRIMLRRVTPEYSTCGLRPLGKEQLLSDVYEFRISGARMEGSMILRIPVHGRPGDYDDVFVKMDKGAYSAPLRAVKQDNDMHWVCHVRMNLTHVQALILVTRPRVERFSVTSTGGDYTSSLDNRLRVHVQQNTFKGSAELALEVLTSPTFEEEEFDNVMSLSHFYSLTSASDRQQRPQNELIISIPLPDTFFSEGEFFVLLRRPKIIGKGMQIEQWEVISKNPDVCDRMVKFRSPDLGLFCLLEKARRTPLNNTLSAETCAVRYVTQLHRKAENGEHDVIVFAMARQSGSSAGGVVRSQADVVVEVTLSHKLHSRLDYWKSWGYVDHKPNFSNIFTAQTMQEFLIQVGGCCQDADSHLSTLLFHPRRDNSMRFTVAQRHLPVTNDSWVDVFTSQEEPPRAPSQMTVASTFTASLAEQLRPSSQMTTASGISKVDSLQESVQRRSTTHISKLMLKLPWPRTQAQQEEERMIKFAALSPFSEDQNTGILEAVAWGLGSDWVKEAILLGVAPSTVQRLADTKTINDGQRAMQMLEQWRSIRQPRQDRGVSELLVTLQKAGREDLVKVVLNRLRNWLSQHGMTGGPMAALLQDKSLTTPRTAVITEADTGDNGEAEPTTPEPMSGVFMHSLCQEMGPRFDLAADLGVSKPEVDTIMADPLLTNDEDKMFKLLLLSRDKQEKMEEGLKMLLSVTRDRKLTAAHTWILETTKKWIELQGPTNDHFAHAVGDVLYDIADAT